MAIKRNSAKCVECGVEIESRHVHDFVPHYHNGDLRFFVDGGKEYLRRGGDPANMVDTSEYIE